MRTINELPSPLNSEERYLHAIIARQDVMIEQLSSLVEHIAKRDNVAVTSGKAEVQAEPSTPKKPATRKRATAKKKEE